jgi:hypothetical protein
MKVSIVLDVEPVAKAVVEEPELSGTQVELIDKWNGHRPSLQQICDRIGALVEDHNNRLGNQDDYVISNVELRSRL